MNGQPITEEQLKTWGAAYDADPTRRLAGLALSHTDLNNVAYVTAEAGLMDPKFSVEVKTLPVTDQKSSGRCWLFAATNVLRERIAAEKNLEQFELSQSWLAFWDKFERCNFFLESMLETADLPITDRTVMFILATGVHDGGQWDMFANIVRKYGVVPKAAFGETHQSGNTRQPSYVLNRYLKGVAVKLRQLKAGNASGTQVQQAKNEALGKCYAFLCSCYGVPPTTFDFETVDKDGCYTLEKGMTPISFRDEYVGDLLEKIVSCIHAPTRDKPFHETYTIRLLGNVVGGQAVKHLNLTMEEMKDAIIRQLQAGKVVWFGSDVGHYGDRVKGIWDDKLFDYELLTGLDMSISKADALDYGLAAMNHAMVITGVNLKDGKPTRWKIENSWGEEHGEKGYYVCSDSWFDQYVFQAAIEKEYLGELAALAEKAPHMLEPWDPMGTLAD